MNARALKILAATRLLPLLLLLTLPVASQAQFVFVTNNGAITIMAYSGSDPILSVPSTVNGYPVTRIASLGGNASVTNLYIPSSVTNIADGAFSQMAYLMTITMPWNGFYAASPDGVLFNSEGTVLACFPNYASAADSHGFYAIPTTVTTIEPKAFFVGVRLKTLAISSNVVNIPPLSILCVSLTNFFVDYNNPYYSDYFYTNTYPSDMELLLNKSGDTLVAFAGGIDGSYTIPPGISHIGGGAFLYSQLSRVTIPGSVTTIGDGAFVDMQSLTSVTISSSVISIGDDAFGGCPGLTSVYFNGNAPTPANDTSVFEGDNTGTVYYQPGTTGWGPQFDGWPTWNPQAQTSGAGFGVQNQQFGFNITGNSNLVVIVQACTNLASPVWQPVQTNKLTGGTAYFSDPQWTNYPNRFYRFRSP